MFADGGRASNLEGVFFVYQVHSVAALLLLSEIEKLLEVIDSKIL